jgi:hypothetical protein
MLVEEFDDLIAVLGKEEVAAWVHLYIARTGGVLGPGPGLVQGGLGIAER